MLSTGESILALLLLVFLYILPAVFTFISLMESKLDERKYFTLAIISLIVALLPVFNLIIPPLMYDDREGFTKWKHKYNRIRVCNNCDIYSYYGRTLVHDDMDGTMDRCPYCNSQNIWSADKKESLIGAPFTWYEAIKLRLFINKLETGEIQADHDNFLADQMARFIKLQEEQIEKMTKE